jgi:hypothetical protein
MASKKSSTRKPKDDSPSRRIDARIEELGDWRGETLSRIRALIRKTDPEAIEEWKWRGVPVWSHDGILCTGETYKSVVKVTFAKGASLKDPSRLFNSSLDGNVRRAIDFREGEKIDAKAFTELIRAAVDLNQSTALARTKKKKASTTQGTSKAKPKLLSGGNPQIAKGDGDAPVQAYIAAMPGWKRDVGSRLDALVTRAVPEVRKAVKWNSPFYGVDGRGWFVSFHCFTKYVKVTFFNGSSLRPLPLGESKDANVRYLDVYEDAPLDEKQFTAWVKRASQLPGWEAGMT